MRGAITTGFGVRVVTAMILEHYVRTTPRNGSIFILELEKLKRYYMSVMEIKESVTRKTVKISVPKKPQKHKGV